MDIHLPAQPPYNAPWVFEFLNQRALPGLEAVDGLSYRRRLSGRGAAPEWLEVRWRGDGLQVRLPSNASPRRQDLLARIRRLFDVDADSSAIDRHLSRDPLLAPWVRQAPGLRVPGAWDGFETAVRAVLGQQVSVARARALAAKLMLRFGQGAFPGPQALQDADVAAIGMPGKRGEAIRRLATAAAKGALTLDAGADSANLQAALCALPGIGPWTAAYIALRVAKDADAFLPHDWVVRKVLKASAAQAQQRAASWAPWRGYAVMLLWRAAGYGRAARKQGEKGEN